MADNAAAQPAATPSDTKPSVPVNPDRVGEELADDANIWHVYDRVAKEDDERRTKAWDNGLNNLALFAGLFSAVTTAFIIEAQQDLEPDYALLTFLVLNASTSGEKFVQQPFVIPSSARTVNCLWVASLVLSLSAALIAIMGKDWIGMYTARPVCNLRQWAEMRSYRLNCVEQWYMSGVIATAPVLLHISLLLFGAGLVLFISSDPLTHHLTLGLSLGAGVLYLVTTFSAVVFSTSPFKSPATQMIRAALSALFSYLRSVIYRPKRNLVGTLLRDINAMVVGRPDGTELLPRSAPETQKLRARLQPRHVLHSAGRAATVYTQTILASICIARHRFQWSRVRSKLHSIVSTAHRIPVSEWFFASTWTDLPATRRPELLANALSWLSGASQAPDDFRAVVFALGDLEIGPQVGMHISLALCTRLRAEIRRSHQQADFLTMSRYILANQNVRGHAVLGYTPFHIPFGESIDSALLCEDGLAATVKGSYGYVLPSDIQRSLPAHVTQPRMMEFLLPSIQQTEQSLTSALILIGNRYIAHLPVYPWRGESVTTGNLEAHLYRSLDASTREAYDTEVTDKYAGTTGLVEILTFLCCCDVIDDVCKPAAIGLIMHLVERDPSISHRCLAYLFGDGRLSQVAWPEKNWPSYSLWCLSQALTFRPDSVGTSPDERQFHLALARTSVMLLSPRHEPFGHESVSIVFISQYLYQSPCSLGDDTALEIMRLILDSAALLKIVGTPDCFCYDDEPGTCGVDILVAIISDAGFYLSDHSTFSKGERLFASSVFTEVTKENGDTLIWDLGQWLHTQAPDILKKCPSSAPSMQNLHDALVQIYPLCEANHELRAYWDRIGYPGRPGDIFSDPFLDVGAFFEYAEAPRTRPGDIFDDSQLNLAEFFDGAEERRYRQRY